MNNLFNTDKIYSVSELNNTVKQLIRQEFPSHVWVCGEIQDLRDRGIINLNLVQKHAAFDEIVAQVKAVIFENVKPQIIRRIKETEGSFELKKDIEVKLLCKVDLYVKTGQFSLTVVDIDPVYTIGKIAQGRQKIIEELRTKGLLERNKQLRMPSLPLRIGLITSSDSAAYHDFIDELKKSSYGFKVFLYDSYMQGAQSEQSVLAGLSIFNSLTEEELDIILIARGGGSTADLSWFDNKKIAEAVALSRFPVLSALGHQINTTITDMVAHTSVKTPTKGAQVLVEAVQIFLQQVTDLEKEICFQAENFVERKKKALENAVLKIDSGLLRYFRLHRDQLRDGQLQVNNFAQRFLTAQKQQLCANFDMLKLRADTLFKNCRDEIQFRQDKVRLLDPRHILKRGYSVTLQNGKALKSVDNVTENDIIKTLLFDGMLESRVTEKAREHEQENDKI
ncbi:MAG: exodeoxyribonuclease VII large subunit [Candidatus Omnitrophota bacterium]